MVLLGLPKKALEKHRLELVELHKRCIKSYLYQRGLGFTPITKFFKLYDYYLDEKNIEQYWNIPVNLFAQALVKDNLQSFFIYTKPDVRKDRKKSIRRKVKD